MSIKPILNNPNALNNKTLNLFSNEIQVNNINTPNLNGVPVDVGGVSNPLTENLKLGGFAIVEEIGSISPSLNIDQLDEFKRIDLKINGLSRLEVENNQVNSNVDLNLNNNSILNAFGLNTQFLASTSQIETPQIISTGLGQQSYVANPHRFTADGNPATEQLEINNSEISSFKLLNMNNNPIINVSSINNLSPIGGLSTGISNSLLLTTSTAEQSILPITFLGTRTIPPNTFKIGDAFYTTCSGSFSSNNGDTLTIRLKSNGGILDTFNIPLNASAGVFFELAVNFSIRNVGSAGVAELVSSFQFTYNQSAGGNFQGIRSVSINNTTFDTTILNTLDITGQFSSASASNSIETIHSVLYKTY